MAQWLDRIKYGSGKSGSPAVSGTINTYATCTGTATQLSLTTTLAASAGDVILIHQSQGTGAGQWELNYVLADAGATLTLAYPLAYSYVTGAQAVLVPQYTGGTLSGTVTGTSWGGTTGGIIALMSNGDLTFSGSANLNGNIVSSPGIGNTGSPAGGVGGGFRGGASDENNTDGNAGCHQGEGTVGAGTYVHTANGNGGGGGSYNGNPYWATGGGGGNSAAGSDGAGSLPGSDTVAHGGLAAGNAGLTSMVFGGGGGGSAYEPGNTGAGGGSGAGIIVIFAKSFTLSGTLAVNGGAGRGGANAGGSGGAGGSVLIKCQNAALGTNKITALAGAGGSNNGVAGSVGRIHIDYADTYTGTTTPTIDATNDTNLKSPIYGGMI